MKSQLLDPQIVALRQRKFELEREYAEVKKEHDLAEKKTQQASRVSMNLYYRMREIADASAQIDEAIKGLGSVEKERW